MAKIVKAMKDKDVDPKEWTVDYAARHIIDALKKVNEAHDILKKTPDDELPKKYRDQAVKLAAEAFDKLREARAILDK